MEQFQNQIRQSFSQIQANFLKESNVLCEKLVSLFQESGQIGMKMSIQNFLNSFGKELQFIFEKKVDTQLQTIRSSVKTPTSSHVNLSNQQGLVAPQRNSAPPLLQQKDENQSKTRTVSVEFSSEYIQVFKDLGLKKKDLQDEEMAEIFFKAILDLKLAKEHK